MKVADLVVGNTYRDTELKEVFIYKGQIGEDSMVFAGEHEFESVNVKGIDDEGIIVTDEQVESDMEEA